jgi:hypothetical protein
LMNPINNVHVHTGRSMTLAVGECGQWTVEKTIRLALREIQNARPPSATATSTRSHRRGLGSDRRPAPRSQRRPYGQRRFARHRTSAPSAASRCCERDRTARLDHSRLRAARMAGVIT